MKILVARETLPRERRVALTPEVVARLIESGHEVAVQRGAGEAAAFTDAAYREAGAGRFDHLEGEVGTGDVVVRIQPPQALDAGRHGPAAASAGHEVDWLARGSVLIGFLQPLTSPELVRRLAERGVTAYAMELIPRITRAQPMDALSSQATAAGYHAVLAAAAAFPRFFPMLMTAAGTVAPARVLVLGAGVAGLQAIATARRLGAVVQGYDIRPAVKEQVESLGATFVGLVSEEAETAEGYAREQTEEDRARAREHLAGLVREADVVITTALVPGRRAPVLVTTEMVQAMRPGSVVVDLAAEAGGNCELTERGERVEHGGVLVMGMDDAASAVAADASRMYARNLHSLIRHLERDGRIGYDPEDEIAAGACVTHAGEVVHADVAATL